MTPDTLPHVQPYEYHILPGNRIMIRNPAGCKVILHKSQVQTRLQEEIPFREKSAHETIMLETAWKMLEEG